MTDETISFSFIKPLNSSFGHTSLILSRPFDYHVYNYGNIEAKNVIVTCKLKNAETGITEVNIDHKVGNVASNSYLFQEFTPTKPVSYQGGDNLYTSYCYVKSCDNCLLLDNQIPEFVEYYNS